MGDLNRAEPLEQSSTKTACRILYRKQSAAGGFHQGISIPFSDLLQDHTGTVFICHLSRYLQISFPQPEEFQHLSIRAVDKGVVYVKCLRLGRKVYILRRNFACSAVL